MPNVSFRSGVLVIRRPALTDILVEKKVVLRFLFALFIAGGILSLFLSAILKDTVEAARPSAVLPPHMFQHHGISFPTDDSTKVDSTRKNSFDSLFLFPPPFAVDSTTVLLDSSKMQLDSLKAFITDSLSKMDTLGFAIDTTYTIYLDSTSRLAQFVHHRTDKPVAQSLPTRRYSLYLDVNSAAYKREVELDSSGTFVKVRETVNGLDVKFPITMTLEEYIAQRMEYEKKNNWRTFVYEYRFKEQGDDLSGLFGKITKIEIPVPANPLLSIFGKNVIHIDITGAVDIRAAYRNQQSDQETQSSLDRSRSEPDFNQDVQINVNSTIGDKLNILADWNTQRTFEYENQLKIKYTGYEDEIVQSVEAGNVSLQTPSLVGGGQALFGIKAKFQTGPLTLTTLLSQKKGQAKEISLTGGAQTQARLIYPADYSTSYYFVDTLYREFWEPLHSSVVPSISDVMRRNEIVEIEVWVSLASNQINPKKRLANAYIKLDPIEVGGSYPPSFDTLSQTNDPGESTEGYFVLLDESQYKFDHFGGFIALATNVNDNQAIAVAYRIQNDNQQAVDNLQFGEFHDDTTGTLILKLVKPAVSLTRAYRTAWNLQLRNIYSLGGKDLKKEGFSLRAYFKPVDADTTNELKDVSLLRLLGIDQYDDAGAPLANGDGRFDFIPKLTVDVDRAEIIFPTLEPFDEGLARNYRAIKNENFPDSLQFTELYDTARTTARNNSLNAAYQIAVTSSTSRSSRIGLGSFNIVEGSVQVLMDGIPLQPNIDYTVDYIIGEVVIKNEQALVPGRNLEIKYEQNDLFQLAAKTLIGARGEIDVAQNSKLGFTIMNLNQETLSDKVRIGEEPTNNTMFGVDGSTMFELPIVTKALDAVPLLRATEMSSLRLGGEGAYMLPDPNTKKSPIESDQGASIAYIDDFEGARRTIPFNITYYSWRPASPPMDSFPSDNNFRRQFREKTFAKAKLSWYNNTREYDAIPIHEIWPNRSVRTGQDFAPVLHLDFQPGTRGMYNFSTNLDSTLGSPSDTAPTNTDLLRRNWNGVMRYISTTAGNLIEQNVNYLEIWIKATSSDINDLRRGRLFINLGSISEDVLEYGKLNSEDIISTSSNPTGVPNNVLNPDEDVGIDMLSNAGEKSDESIKEFLNSPANLGRSDIDENDPSGDDFNFSTGSNDFSRLNGPENNGRQGQGSPDGIYPNTEDLNGNGNVDQVNAYLEYEIPLDTVFFGKQGLEQNGLVVGGNYSKGWYQLRIPLLDSAHLVTSPTSPLNVQSILQNVQYVRMYLTGFEKPVDVRIADISLVGNQWLPLTKNDSTLRVSVVNIEDNPQYSSPPGVIRERDRTQPDQEIFGNEQSLSLLLNNLPPGESRQAIKYYTVRPLDLFNYKSMKIFVHGDPTFEYNVEGEGIADAVVFMRFGSDTLNFYEYSRPLRSGWDEISIDFEELTSIKTGRTRNDTLIRRSVPSGQRGDSIGVRGNPALTQVRFFSIGLRNTTNYSPPHRSRYFRSPRYLSGEVWVNELRVVDVHNTPGYAYRFDTQFKLSDFGTLGFNFSTISPDFHGLDQRFGSRVRQQNWAVSTNFALDKFLPQDWQGTSLPFGYSHAENISKPKYLPSTDILVEEAATRAGEQAALQTPSDPDASQRASDSVLTISQTLTTRESYAMPSVRIKFPWQIWYVRDILNNFSYRFTYTTSDERSPSVAYRNTWSWDFGIGYSYSFAVNHYYQPFSSLFDGIYLFNDFKDWKLYYFPLTNLSANLSAQRSRTTALNRGANAVSQETRTFNGGKSFGFGWKLTEGGLLNLAGDYGIQIQRDLLFLDNDTVGRDFWSILNSIFIRGRDRHFGQRFTVNTKPKIPNILDIPTYLDLTGGYSVNYSWQNTFQPTDIGKSSGWSNTITLSSNFRLKSLTDPWFKSTDQGATAPPSRQRESKKDTTSAHTDTTQQKKKNLFEPIKNVAKYIIKIPFLDYESINISYNQSNNVANSGVVGSSGFLNFWGRLPFQGSVPENGPSRLYQLGLISDPSGTLEYSPSSKFPFIGWQVVPGVRAPNANLSNVFSQTNKITLRTNRPLWEGATLELSWNLDWTFSRNTTVRTDTFGMPTPSAPTTSGSIGRSFLSIPPVFAGKFFKSNLEDVGKKYEQYKNDRPQEVALTEAFEQGMEALPFLNKVLGQFVPRPNWSLRWNGLEKISGLNSIFQSMQLEHGYTSSFKRGFQGTSGGNERTLNESVNYGFSPLAGVNMGFKELLKGTLGGNFRYSTTTTYDLNLSAGNITETNSKEISLSLTYARRGFEIPLFGLSLKNDIDMTFTFSTSYNARRQHDPDYLSSNQEGTPLEGNTRTTMEPRLRYVLSSRVTAALFYRYTKMKPDEGGSTIPGTTTQEAGLDIHIAIQ